MRVIFQSLRCLKLSPDKKGISNLRVEKTGVNTDYDKVKEVILENTEITRDHLTPELLLNLLTPNCPLYHSSVGESSVSNFLKSDLHKRVFHNPFWSIYWPGGQALTKFIFDHQKNEGFIRNKSVLDLGSGCGASAIAAKMLGASRVLANDTDKFACIAAIINAELNNVNIDVSEKNMLECPPTEIFDVILIGDLLYDQEVTEILIPWLDDALKTGSKIYMGDPGRHGLTHKLKKRMSLLASYELPENVKRENHGFSEGHIWKFGN